MVLFENFVNAQKATGRPLLEIILEAIKLRLSFTKLGLSEYFDFQLYKTDLTWPEKKLFGGIRTQSILEEILIDDYSRFLSLDKVTMYTLLEGYNLPVPKLTATYRSLRPSSLIQIEQPHELEAFLRNPDNLPVYIKRSFGAYGRGNTLVT